jgi:DNA polymerase-3 subunit beta
MKIRILLEELLNGIRIIENAIPTKSTMPALNCVLIETTDNKIRLTGTDLDIGIRCVVPAVEVIEEGKAAIPAKKFKEILTQIREKEIVFEVRDNKMILNTTRTKFLILGVPPQEYPSIPIIKDGKELTVENSVLKDMFKKTIFAVSTEETRYNLNGVRLVNAKDKLEVVSSDGRRLAYVFYTGGRGKNDALAVTIPEKTVSEIINLIPAVEGETKIVVSENQINFYISEILVISRIVEGDFPDYNRVIPKTCPIKLKLKKSEFEEATERISVMCQEKMGQINYHLSKNALKIYTSNSELGEAEEMLPVEYTGDDVRVGFKPEYILEALEVILSEEIYFEFNEPLTPHVIRPADEKEKFIYVVMPLRVSG